MKFLYMCKDIEKEIICFQNNLKSKLAINDFSREEIHLKIETRLEVCVFH